MNDTEFMDKIRVSMTEIEKLLKLGSVTLAQADQIARKNGIRLHDVMPELGAKYKTDYTRGIISK